MNYGERLQLLIDAAFVTDFNKREKPFRTHLGASVIGDSCMRKIWYGFFWYDYEQHDGRQLRLFERGQLEEERFKKLLELVGATVYTHDSAGKQFKMSMFGGHFGGSTDGVAVNLPDLNEPVLLEMKTHNDKSFKKLKVEGVVKSKPQHVKQMQTYMPFLGVKKALYCAVNKNDDELYFELLDHDPEVTRANVDKAESIIFGEGMPQRISDTPAWFECKFCPMRDCCHNQKEPKINCRTCKFSKPERDGSWSCAKGKEEIITRPMEGCDNHKHKYDI